MAEYISKDDAQTIIKVLDAQSYTLREAKSYLSIKERLQKYIDSPEEKRQEIVAVSK